MSRVMLTAGEARAKALQDLIVLREIRDLEEGVIQAAEQGQYSVIVNTTTTMAKNSSGAPGYTIATEYFDTWTGARDDRAKAVQMDKVITYFTDLGYTIERQTNSTTNTTFKWALYW